MINESEMDRGIISRLEETGIPVRNLSRVSVTKGGEEVVYRIKTIDRTIFVRTIQPSRRDDVRRVLRSDIDIGLPKSQFLDGDPALLIMERASGRPLSLLLPIYLLPMVWRTVSGGLSSGFESLGQYHGRLHDATVTDTVRVVDNETYSGKIEFSTRVKPHLGPTVDHLQPWLKRVQDIEIPRGLVHSDPTPHNIYYQNGNVDLIDMDFKPKALLKDRLAVECGVELMTARLPYGRSSQSTALLDAYEHGYETEYSTLEFPYWAYLTLKIAHYAWILDIYLSGKNTALRDRLTTYTDVSLIVNRINELAKILNRGCE